MFIRTSSVELHIEQLIMHNAVKMQLKRTFETLEMNTTSFCVEKEKGTLPKDLTEKTGGSLTDTSNDF